MRGICSVPNNLILAENFVDTRDIIVLQLNMDCIGADIRLL